MSNAANKIHYVPTTKYFPVPVCQPMAGLGRRVRAVVGKSNPHDPAINCEKCLAKLSRTQTHG